MTIATDLVADWSGSGNGVTDNATALDNFRTFARAQSDTVALTIPSGGIYKSTMNAPYDGIASLIVNQTGATLTGTGWVRLAGFAGFSQKAARSARLDTVLAGATSAFCKTASQASRFTAGHYVAIGAQEWQGAAGYPPNFQKVEYVLVTSVNASTGEVRFTPGLTEDYFDYFIETTSGVYDAGGPATMFVIRDPENGTGGLETGLKSDVTINGGFYDNVASVSAGQIFCTGVRFIANDVTCDGCCLIPSDSIYIQYNRLAVTGLQMEVDKNIAYLELNDCNLASIDIQSPAFMRGVFNNVNCTNFWHGTGRRCEIYGGGAPDFQVGCLGYGASQSLIIDGFNLTGGTPDWVISHLHATSDFTLSNGILNYTGSGILPFGAEDSALFLGGTLAGSNFSHIGFTKVIARAYDDGTGHPSHECPLDTISPSFLTGTVNVVQHPCRDVTITNCVTGVLAPYSDGPANKPLFSYATYTDSFESSVTLQAWGIPRIEVEVLRAYTGAQATCTLHIGGKFGVRPKINPGGATAARDFDVIINAKQSGLRSYTTTAINGNKSGDTSTPYGEIWLCDGILPEIAENISGDTSLQKPLIRVTIWTDQGIDPEDDTESEPENPREVIWPLTRLHKRGPDIGLIRELQRQWAELREAETVNEKLAILDAAKDTAQELAQEPISEQARVAIRRLLLSPIDQPAVMTAAAARDILAQIEDEEEELEAIIYAIA